MDYRFFLLNKVQTNFQKRLSNKSKSGTPVTQFSLSLGVERPDPLLCSCIAFRPAVICTIISSRDLMAGDLKYTFHCGHY